MKLTHPNPSHCFILRHTSWLEEKHDSGSCAPGIYACHYPQSFNYYQRLKKPQEISRDVWKVGVVLLAVCMCVVTTNWSGNYGTGSAAELEAGGKQRGVCWPTILCSGCLQWAHQSCSGSFPKCRRNTFQEIKRRKRAWQHNSFLCKMSHLKLTLKIKLQKKTGFCVE